MDYRCSDDRRDSIERRYFSRELEVVHHHQLNFVFSLTQVQRKGKPPHNKLGRSFLLSNSFQDKLNLANQDYDHHHKIRLIIAQRGIMNLFRWYINFFLIFNDKFEFELIFVLPQKLPAIVTINNSPVFFHFKVYIIFVAEGEGIVVNDLLPENRWMLYLEEQILENHLVVWLNCYLFFLLLKVEWSRRNLLIFIDYSKRR